MTDTVEPGDDEDGPVISVEALLAAAQIEALPLDADPTARLLGLVNDDRVLDPGQLKAARIARNLTVSELASRLSSEGWSVTGSDVFRWESRSTSDVRPALISAIGAALGRSVLDLTRVSERDQTLAAIRQTDLFQELAKRWAALFDLSVIAARDALESRILTTVHRGDRPDPEQSLRTLEVFVNELEQRGRP